MKAKKKFVRSFVKISIRATIKIAGNIREWFEEILYNMDQEKLIVKYDYIILQMFYSSLVWLKVEIKYWKICVWYSPTKNCFFS